MRFFATLLITYVVAVVQTAVCPFVCVAGAGPDLLALEAYAIVLLGSSPYSFLWAGWLGLVHDLASGGTVGVAMGWFTLVGYLLAKLRKQIYTHHPLTQTLLVLLAVTLSLLLLAASRWLLGETGQVSARLVQAVVGGAVYTAGVALPVFLLLRRWSKPELSWAAR